MKRANTFMLRWFFVASCRQAPGARRWDRSWGNGVSSPDEVQQGRWWLRSPKWLAPLGNFKHQGWVFMYNRRTGAALSFARITKRWPLDEDEPYYDGHAPYRERGATLPGDGTWGTDNSGVADTTAGQ